MIIFKAILRWVLPLVILGAAIGGFMALGGPKPPPRKTVEEPAAAPVRTAAIEAGDGRIEIEADGIVVPLREVTLAAEVSGRVLRKTDACNEGQLVKKGDILFEIDPRDYELDVERLEREAAQAKLMIAEIDEEIAQNATAIDLARRQVELARREVSRLDTLKAGRIVTESEHDRAVRDELTAANALTAQEGQKRVLAKRRNRMVEAESLAGTMLAKSRLDLARTRITAPADGRVVDDKVEQDSFVAKGTPVVVIEDTSSAEVKTNLRMDEVARVWGARRDGARSGTGQDVPESPAKVVFTIDDRRYEWDGVLSRYEGRGLDEKTRTLPCRVRVAEPSRVRAIDRYGAPLATLPADAPRSLLRGMFVEVWLQVDVPQPLVSVPEEAVRPSGDLFVMREGRLHVLHPRPFHAAAGRVVYDQEQSGLLATDRVVVSQLANPRDGMELAETSP
ncbi:MAG: biotin/lipoyl-binding protein [Planctomycetia bacterium]|nr:biotin/lipoyl-binding protein [Planctomycetia bacterium]